MIYTLASVLHPLYAFNPSAPTDETSAESSAPRQRKVTISISAGVAVYTVVHCAISNLTVHTFVFIGRLASYVTLRLEGLGLTSLKHSRKGRRLVLRQQDVLTRDLLGMLLAAGVKVRLLLVSLPEGEKMRLKAKARRGEGSFRFPSPSISPFVL